MGPFPDVAYENFEVNIRRNDRIVLYTDGIIEMPLKSGEFIGIHGLKSLIRKSSGFTTEQTADLIIEKIKDSTGNFWRNSLNDDITLVIIDMVPDTK